ncbi:MAG: hypothetical protein EBU92_04415 [Betaproteobacteria bacterium]|nr:hypothetical protein [Betaproteobacteria bacterium]
MRVIAWFKRLFSKRASRPENLSIEIDSIIEKFHLVKEAKRLAEMGLPSFHEKKPTQKELEVVEHLNLLREVIQQNYIRQSEDINSRVVGIELSYKSLQSDALNAEFERQTRKLMDEEGAWLKKLAYNAMVRFKELEIFKKNNGLEREANFPSPSGLMLRYSVLVFLIGVEGIMNANFFAEGLSSGLIGGFIYAALLAGINVLGCFFLGKFAVPWVVSKPVAGKLFGSFSIVFAACFMFFVAMSIGHIREQLMAASVAPTREAWEMMQNHFFGLSDLVSWFLVAMSLGFGIAALFDGLSIDDTYPGYGAMVRRCNQARDEFEAEFEEVREELEELKQEKLDLINQGFKTLHDLSALLRKIMLEKEAVHRECTDKINQTEVVLYAVIRKFRIENEVAREDGLRPSYFDTLPSLSPINLPRIENEKENNLIASLEKDIRLYENSVNEQREKVYTLYEQYISRLNHLKYH